MITKWLHIHQTDGLITWVQPILSSINKAINRGECVELKKEVYELCIHITTRLSMIPVIIDRIKNGCSDLYQQVSNYEDDNVFEQGKRGYAMPVEGDIVNHLLIDIDSFFFEIHSCREMVVKLLKEIYRHRGEKIIIKNVQDKIIEMLGNNGQETNWFQFLYDHRNYFVHKGAPYIAINISNDSPDLLIMKENITSFEDENKFIKISEINEIIKGFAETISIINDHIVSLYSCPK